MKRALPILTIFAFFLIQCVSNKGTPFTKTMLENNPKPGGGGFETAFYLSKSITLFRNITKDGGIQVADSEKVTFGGEEHEKVVISAKAKGRMLAAPSKEGAIAVTFNDDPNRFLYFFPDASKAGRFTLMEFGKTPFTPGAGKERPPAYDLPRGTFPTKYSGRQFFIYEKGQLPFLFVKNWK